MMSWSGIVTVEILQCGKSLREELRRPSDKRRQCSSYFDGAAVDLFRVAGPLSKQPDFVVTPSNGHNAVIILQLAIPRTNRHDAGQEPEATEGSTTECSLLRPRAAAAVSGCASEFCSPGLV
jgi:hypothetical protein